MSQRDREHGLADSGWRFFAGPKLLVIDELGYLGSLPQDRAPTTTRHPNQLDSGAGAGAGRACPHCGKHINIVNLLTTPEAARPTVPEPGVIPLRRA